jgi:hypothetical protein
MNNPIGEIDQKTLPCPFCGSRAMIENYIIEAAVFCTNTHCGAKVKAKHAPRHDTGIEEAIEKWERRV